MYEPTLDELKKEGAHTDHLALVDNQIHSIQRRLESENNCQIYRKLSHQLSRKQTIRKVLLSMLEDTENAVDSHLPILNNSTLELQNL